MKFQEAYSKFQSIIKKVPMKYVYFVLLLALLSFTVWTRVQPLYLPVMDVQAENNVQNFYRQQIQSSIDQQYPNLPEANKQVLVDKELSTFLSDNEAELSEQVGMLANEMRNIYQDPNGQTYLLGIDPYHYYRQTYYELEYGMAGTTIEDDTVIDEYRLAPLGRAYESSFHSIIPAAWHKVLNMFGDYDLTYSFFMVGVLMVMLTVLFAYLFLAKELSPVTSLMACLVLATTAFFVSRTTGESSDTDIYVLLFPFLSLWLYRYATGKKALVYTALSGVVLGVYSIAWGAWWYTFVLMSAAIIVSMVLSLIQKKAYDYNKAAMFHVATFLSVGFLSGTSVFFNAYIQPIKNVLNFKSVAVTDLWPNIFTTVAELNNVAMETVISQLGGQLLVLLAVIGTLYALYLSYKKKEYFMGVYLVLWWVASLYTTTQGIRFILLVIFPFVIGLAYFIQLCLNSAKDLQKQFQIPAVISKSVAVVVLAIILLPSILAGVAITQNSVPSFDDGWYNSLTYVRDNVSEDIIMTSWWDFGYWFRAIADRPVTFDGGTQVGYNAYWVGKSLSTNEYLSTGIIRMLNCGQNTAFETLYPSVNNYQQTVDMLESLVVLPKEEAGNVLEQNGLPLSVLEYTHCDAPNSIVIASGDMIAKSGVWGHFGAWNFTKAEMYQSVNDLSATEALSMLQAYGLSDSEAVTEYNAMQVGADRYIASYPQLFTQFSCTGDTEVVCNVKYQNVQFTIDYNTVSGQYNVSGNVNIELLVMDDAVYTINPGTGISVKVDTTKNIGYLASTEHVNGLFANMYYLENSDCYTLLYTGNSNSMGKIMVWESDYSCLE